MALDMNTNNVYYLDMTGITGATTITLANENNLPTEEILTDWGDGTQNSELTHTYSTAGEYIVVSNLQNNTSGDNNLKDYLTKMVVYYSKTPGGLCFNYNKITEVILTKNWAEKTIEKYGQKVSTAQMFRNCPLLELPNLELVKQFKPTYCVGMFYNCQKFTSMDLTGWDLSNCTAMDLMFTGCTNLTEIRGIESLNVSKCTSFDSLFLNCSSLTSLDISSWDISSATKISAMFSGCENLIELKLMKSELNNITNVSSMFRKCSSLTSIDLSSLILNKATTTQYMFMDCTSLTDIRFNDLSFSNINNCADMFSNCMVLTNVDLSSIRITKNIKMNHMFNNCPKLQSIKMFNCDGNVETIQYAFNGCKELKTLDLSNLTIAPNTSVAGMFWSCKELEMVDLSNIRDIGDSGGIFTECPKLTTLGLLYSTSNTINTLASKMPSTEQKTIYYQDADTSQLTPVKGVTFKKYQTTTLSLNEPIQLRSIGDVHDEINYETGEYIQRIGECIYEDDSTPTYNKQIGGYLVSMEVKGKIGLAVSDGMGAISDKLINQNFTQYDFGIYGNLNGNLNIFDKTTKSEEEFINKYRGTKFQFVLLEPIITKIDTTILDQNNSYKSSQQTYDEQTYISVQSDTVVTPSSSVDYEIYSSTGTVTGTNATIENAEAGTPVSGVVYGETLLNVIQEPSEDEYVIIGDNFEGQSGTLENTVEGNIKSAILKGQTLVSLVDSVDSNEVGNYNSSPCSINLIRRLNSETVTIIFNVISLEIPNGADGIVRIGGGWTGAVRHKPILGVNKVLCNGVSNSWLGVFSNSEAYDLGQRITISDVMVLKGDYTNIDIPYFEGMQLINLYPNQTVKKITWSSGRYYTEQGTLTSVNATANHKYFEEYFEVMPNHTLRVKGNNTTKYLNFYDESKTFISRATLTSTDDLVATVPSNARYYRYSMLVNSGMTDETVIYDEDMKINIADTSVEADYLQKMGVLQTAGKNLLININKDNPDELFSWDYNGSQPILYDESNDGFYSPTSRGLFLNLEKDKTYTLSLDVKNRNNGYGCLTWFNTGYSEDFAWTDSTTYVRRSYTFTTSEGKTTTDFVFYKGIYFKNLQLVEGTTTKYEPFKTNILFVNEELKLRSSGEIYDELDLLNGKMIQRIDENNEILEQEITKIVSTTILDQDDKPTDNLHTFDTTTYINTYAQGGGLIPFVNIPKGISYDTMLKANTQYTIKLNRTNIIDGTPLAVNLGGTELSIEDSADSFTITTPNTLTNNTLSIGGANNKVKDVMVIEGDYVDRDLDFFEGFVHVENPTIYTVGKNKCFVNDFPKLYPKYFELREGRVYGKAEYAWESTGIHMAFNFKQNTSYTISYDKEEIVEPNGDRSHNVVCMYTDGTKTTRLLSDKASIITDGNKTIDAIYLCNPWKVGGYIDNIQIEEGTTRTSYEPYQSNILTTYPQVTLRSIGDIKDEWDVVGETVTRRVGKITFDGTLDGDYTFTTDTNLGIVTIRLPRINDIIDTGANILGLLSDKYISASSKQPNNIICYTRCIMIIKPLSELELYNSTEKIKAFLQQNPFTVQYELATPVTESVRITPPNPQTSSASITIPTQLNHVEDMSDFLVWNPYKEHYVRYNYVENGTVLDNYTWENLTDLNERQFVEFYNRRTYIYQPYHNYVASHDSKGTSKYVLIEPNQDYTVSVRFSELPTCETVKVNLGGTEVEMNVNDPHVHITTPNTLVNNLCSISGDGLDGKVTDILVIHCLEHEGFADIDYFEGIDGIGEIVDNKVSIIMEQTNGNLIDVDGKIYDNGNGTQFLYIKIRPNKSYNVKTLFNTNYYLIDKNDAVSTRGSFNNGSATFASNEMEEKLSLYCTVSTNGSSHTHIPIELSYADMEKDYIRPRYNDTQEIILPMQLHRINTVYDNFYYDEMKGYYRIQQSIGHKYFVGADSENWTLIERGQRVLRFRYNNADIQMKPLGEYMTNLLPNGTATSPYESCTFNGTTFIVSFDIERFEIISLEQFKLWLSEHPLHLYYQLMTPIMVDLPQYNKRIEFNTYKDEIYTFFKNCKPTVFTLGIPLDKTYRFYEYEESQGYANRVELTDERMTDEDTLYIDTIHGSGFSNLIENPNNVETLLKPNYQGKAVSHTLTNGKVSSIKVHGFEPNETTIANYNSTLKQYELIVQAQKGQNINTQTLAVPYKLEVYEDGTKDKVYYDEQNKVFRFEGGSITNPPYNNSYIFNTPLEVFKGIAPRTGLIAEIKVKFNSGTTSARIYYSLDGGATTAYSTLRSMTDEVEYYIGFFNTGGTKLDYATKLSAEAEYINLSPLSSTLPESLIITQIQHISECAFILDKTYYFDSLIKPLELDVYNGETIITEQSGAIVTINNNGLHKDALTYTDETYTVYWTYVGGEGNVTITLGGTKVEVVGTQGYATLKTAIDGVQDGLIIGGYNLSIKDLMLVKGERIEDLAYFEGSRAVGTAFVDENGETKYKITLVTGSELINDKFENRITFEDNNKHNVVVTKLLGNKPNKK